MPSRFLGAADRVLCGGWGFLCAGSGGRSTLWPLSFSAASFAGSLGSSILWKTIWGGGLPHEAADWRFGSFLGFFLAILMARSAVGYGRPRLAQWVWPLLRPLCWGFACSCCSFFYRGLFVGDGVGSELLLLMWACATALAFEVHRVETTLTLQTYM